MRAFPHWSERSRVERIVLNIGLRLLLLVGAHFGYLYLAADDIREAVVRYQVTTRQSGDTPYFTIDGSDPSEEFLKRFKQDTISIKGATDCCELRPEFLVDKRTGAPAVHFSIGRITPSGLLRVNVAGRVYCGITCASGGHYIVVRKWSGWEVVDYDVRWVS